MRIVGLDLSLTSTGVAVLDVGDPSGRLHRIQSKGKADATLADRHQRLRRVSTSVAELAELAHLVVIEAPAYSRTTGHMHDRSGLWWTVVRDLWGRVSFIAEVSATARAKYATGKGNASKDAVLAAVVRRYPAVPVDGNDTADALVLAAMGARALGHPIDDMPKVHLEAMAKVRWPHTERDPAS